LRKKYNAQPGDSVEWYEADGEIKVQFRKMVRLEDVIWLSNYKRKN
jgi:phosphoribosylpyrophosphate synthetase